MARHLANINSIEARYTSIKSSALFAIWASLSKDQITQSNGDVELWKDRILKQYERFRIASLSNMTAEVMEQPERS